MRRSVHPAHGHTQDLEDEIPSNAQLKLNFRDREMGWVHVWVDEDMNLLFFYRATLKFLEESLIADSRGDDSSTESMRTIHFFDADEVENLEITEEKRFEHGMVLD